MQQRVVAPSDHIEYVAFYLKNVPMFSRGINVLEQEMQNMSVSAALPSSGVRVVSFHAFVVAPFVGAWRE